MKKIISAGHVCLDITPVFPAEMKCSELSDLLVPGRLIHTEAADVHTGGSVANTGLALKLLGNEVRLLGKIGDDPFGAMIRGIFASYGCSGLITDPAASTSYSVVLAVPGIDRIFLHNPGANSSFVGADIPEEALDDAVMFHFGYPPLMKRMFADDGEELAELFRRVHARGIATSLDFAAIDHRSEAGKADWERILKRVLPDVDFFLPSFEELCFILDRKRFRHLASKGGEMTKDLDLRAEALPLADRLLEMGCRTAVIKCGTSGMVHKTGSFDTMCSVGSRLKLDPEQWADREGVQPCFRPDTVRSALGAGDTSIAAFLTAVLQGKGPAECTALAAAEGACCVTAYDALSGLKPISELEKRIRAGWPTLNTD